MIVRFHKNFEKRFAKLSSKLKAKFKQRRDIFIRNPYDPVLNNHALHGAYKNYRSIDITGDMRAHYEHIDEETVMFIAIGTHSDLYK